MSSQRVERFASTVQRALQEELGRGLNDPRIRGLITVTRVEVSGDLEHMKAYVSVMPDEHAKLTMHGLRAATPHIRRRVMQKVHSREFPSLQFIFDEGLKNQQEVIRLLALARAEREARERNGGAAPDAGSATTPDADGPGAQG